MQKIFFRKIQLMNTSLFLGDVALVIKITQDYGSVQIHNIYIITLTPSL